MPHDSPSSAAGSRSSRSGEGDQVTVRVLPAAGHTGHDSGGGPGTTYEFLVRFPLSRREDEASRPVPVVGSRGPLKILVVDDHPDGARSLARLLNGWGHETSLAHDAPSTLETVASDGPDLVLLGLGVPGMDGRDVARIDGPSTRMG